MSLHSRYIILIPNQQVMALNPKCWIHSREAADTNSIVFNWIRPGVEPTIYHTQGEHANYYTTNVVRESLTSAYQKQVWTVYFLTQ